MRLAANANASQTPQAAASHTPLRECWYTIAARLCTRHARPGKRPLLGEPSALSIRRGKKDWFALEAIKDTSLQRACTKFANARTMGRKNVHRVELLVVGDD
jgi:hypothetical protein